MDYRVLGPLEVWDGERRLPLGGFRQRLVIAALLVHANRPLTTDWLVDAVWGEDPPRTARKTLQIYVSRLRALLGHESIEAAGTGYVLHVSAANLDSLRFEQWAEDGRRLLGADPSAAAHVLRRALALWRGLPFGDLGYESSTEPEAQRLSEMRFATIEHRIAADLESGHSTGLVGELEGLVAEHPLHEGFRGQLMLALYRSGRQAEALRVFQETRKLLGEELGIEPSLELQALEDKILLHAPEIAGPETGVVSDDWTQARNPYKGLRPFRRDDTDDFFGRTELINDLLDRIENHRFVALVGASGSGKSSVAMAGLIPRLPPDKWTPVVMVPGRDPFAALWSALGRMEPGRDGGSDVAKGDDLDLVRAIQERVSDTQPRLLLVIDQFEELLHQVRTEAERSRFVRNLSEAVEDPSCRLTALITLRADFFDRALDLDPLADLIKGTIASVVPLRASDLEAAAGRPGERVGVHLEPELMAELVGDMTNQSGALPLFQYVLTELFEERTGTMLTRADYRRLGGLNGALVRRAEDTYQELGPEARQIAEQVFMRLVMVGPGAEESRRRVDRQSLEALAPTSAMVKTVLDAFDEARLLTFDRSPVSGGATVEVAHEALLREWPRLRQWLDAARDDLRLHGAMVAAAAEWEASGRDPDYVLTGSRLALYDDWTASTSIELTEAEKDFLEAGGLRRDAEWAEEESRRGEGLRLERRSVRRLRALVVVVSVAALVAVALMLFAAEQRNAAAASEREARARELANAAHLNTATDPDLGILLALAAIDVTRSADGWVVQEAEEALHGAVAAHRAVASGRSSYSIAYHPDGGLLVSGDSVRLIDPIRGDVRLDLPIPQNAQRSESFAVSANGGLIAIGSSDWGWVAIHDGNSGAEVEMLGPMGDTVYPLVFSPDGRMLAALAPGPGNLWIWDTATWEVLVRRSDPDARRVFGPREDLAFNADGSRLAMTAGADVWILDVAAGDWISVLTGHDILTTSLAFLPDGNTLVSGSMDETVRFWDVVSGDELAKLDAGIGQVVSLAVDPDGRLLLTGGDQGIVQLWELEAPSARLVTALPGMQSMIGEVDFDASGTMAAAVDTGGGTMVWDISAEGRGEIAAWPADGPVAFSADGTLIAVADPSGRHVIVAATGGWEPIAVLEDVVPYVGERTEGWGDEWGVIGGLAFSPDGSRLATVSHGWEIVPGDLMIWDVRSGDLVRTLTSRMNLGSVVFSADGTRIAVSVCDRPGASALVWDTATWAMVLVPARSWCGCSVGLDADGDLLAVQSQSEDEENVQVWNVDAGERINAMTHRPQWVGAAEFSPAGDRLLTAGADGTMRIWDFATGGLLVLLEGHTGPIEAAQWSADGTAVFSASMDGTVRMWDPATGEMQLQLEGLEGVPVMDVSTDGRWLATSAGGVAKVWALDLDDLIEIANSRLMRSLSPAECATYHFETCPG